MSSITMRTLLLPSRSPRRWPRPGGLTPETRPRAKPRAVRSRAPPCLLRGARALPRPGRIGRSRPENSAGRMPDALRFPLSYPQYRRKFAEVTLKISEVEASALDTAVVTVVSLQATRARRRHEARSSRECVGPHARLLTRGQSKPTSPRRRIVYPGRPNRSSTANMRSHADQPPTRWWVRQEGQPTWLL
jgi:hypothetical protein